MSIPDFCSIQAGHDFPIVFYLALGGSLLSYIYSAPPLKVLYVFFVFLVIKSSHSTFLHVAVKTLHKTWLSSKHCCSWNKMDGLAILPWEQVISVCHGEISCALLSLLKWCRQIEVFPGVFNILQFFHLLNYSFVILQGISTEKCMSCCKCLSTWCTWWDHDISNGRSFL